MGATISILTDKSLLDIGFVHKFLSRESYWAKGRSRAEVVQSIENSLCFGGYLPDGTQVAFARVVTDRVVFAWVMDVFVSPEYRGQGIGKLLVSNILNHEALVQVNGIGLRTEDAHGLYRSFGFSEIPKVQTWMLKTNKK